MNSKLLTFILLAITISCAPAPNLNPIEVALNSDKNAIKTVMSNLEAHELQIKLTTIDRFEDSIGFEDFEFQVNDSNYFYPASTVKFPASILTLEKLNKDGKFNIDTPFFVEGDSSTTTFRKDIVDIFAVSSNHTFNRLFEFLGKDYMNESFASKGIGPIQYNHRLSTPDADELETRSLVFSLNDTTLVSTPSIINKAIIPVKLNKQLKGTGFYRGEELVHEPMNFSEKNYLPISTIHDILKRLIFPQEYLPEQRFDISEDQRNFLIETMAILPKEGGYVDDDHYDSYVKFFLYGDSKDPMPNLIKIHNKVGYAYGYLTDCAYIVDKQNGLEYLLTATVHVNEDGIFNDDIYEYESIGIPFLAVLGRELHKHLLSL